MTRAEVFKRLMLGGAGVAAVRVLPDRVVSVNGPLHLHGDSHLITGCSFHVEERVPVIELHDNRLLG